MVRCHVVEWQLLSKAAASTRRVLDDRAEAQEFARNRELDGFKVWQWEL
jgi:hypothetical protein